MKNLRFPMFFDITDKKVIVIGGGKIGSRRAGTLRDFGANVIVIDPNGALIDGVVEIRREFLDSDLDGAFLCVTATDSREINHKIGQLAKAKNIPVSVSDCREECDFFFPATCTHENMVVGLVSDGSDHHKTARLAKEIRRVLEDFE